MSNTIFITANWTTGALSQQTISRQYDNNRYAVQFIGYPEGDGTEELDLYLLVWMSTAPGQNPGEITPIQLNSDQWYISNYFTQQVQVIKFQLCVLNEAGTYEAHSPIFSGRIGDSLEHNGTSHDIDVSTLFDAYREYLNELIIGAGAVIIDPTLSQSGQAADAKETGDRFDAIRQDLTQGTNLDAYDLSLRWEDGSISSAGNDLNSSSYLTNYVRTGFYPASTIKSITGVCGIGFGSDLSIYCARYRADKTFISYNLRNIVEGKIASTPWELEDDCAYIRFTATHKETSETTVDQAQYIGATATSKLSEEINNKISAEKAKTEKNKIEILGLKNTNSFNILNNFEIADKSSGGISWVVNDDRSVTVTGTATSTSLFNYFFDTEIPSWLKLGAPYTVEFSADVVDLRVLYYDGTSWVNIYTYQENHFGKSSVIIPPTAQGVIFRLAVSSGGTVNETVNPIIYDIPTNSNLGDVPQDYYLQEITQTIEDVVGANTEPGLVFFVCSDLHYASKIGTYPTTLVKTDSVTDMITNMINVGKSIKADGLVCLGDVVDGGASSSSVYTTGETKAQIKYVMEQFKRTGLPFLYVLGNHDDNRYITGEAFTAQQLYAMYMSHCPTERVSDYSFNGLNFYIDYPSYKIRALIVDESDYYDGNWHYGYNTATITWFQNQLAAIPSGWGVIVFTHRGFVQENNEGKRWHIGQENMYNAVQSFINGGGNYIATIYGHSHVDYSNTSPWLEITIGSAKVHNITLGDTYPTGSINPTRTKGTYTEDLWDVLIIQPHSRTIKTIRFGAGVNRSWTY